jgi:NAD-specific glutamate dehydrogenase
MDWLHWLEDDNFFFMKQYQIELSRANVKRPVPPQLNIVIVILIKNLKILFLIGKFFEVWGYS